jgi:hypothetical protein
MSILSLFKTAGMAKAKRRHSPGEEREILEHLQVSPLTPRAESTRCEGLIVEHHYLHDASGLHQCLDITMPEDLSRVRTLTPPPVLGMVTRVVLSLANAAVKRARRANPNSERNTKGFRRQVLSAPEGCELLHALSEKTGLS